MRTPDEIVAALGSRNKRLDLAGSPKLLREFVRGVQEDAKQPCTVKRLSDTRSALTHAFTVGGAKGYLTVGWYDDGTPGEIFLKMDKSELAVLGCLAIAVSMALQRGMPLRDIVKKLQHTRFEPSGPTRNPQIPMATSVVDYVMRWLWLKFGDGGEP